MKKIKIAQIGINRYSHAVQIFNSIKKQNDIFDIAGYALVEDERENFSDLLGLFDGYPELTLEEILQDPEIDAVIIETEEIHLTKYALLAAAQGKHIHMEKPGGQNAAEFEQLISLVKQNGTVFHIGYMYRYNPYIKELMQTVKSGGLGEIFSVEAQMNCRHTPQVRQWLGTLKGGMMFFLGCHLIDLVLQIQGMPANIIVLNKSTGVDGVTAQDYGMAVFEYPNGNSFVKACAEEVGGYARRQLVVSGSKGTVELKPLEAVQDGMQYTEKTEYLNPDWHDGVETKRSALYDRYDDMMASFAKMVRGEAENPYSYDYEHMLYKTILKCCNA